jgi:cellulose biosynthesis protein BcsQ
MTPPVNWRSPALLEPLPDDWRTPSRLVPLPDDWADPPIVTPLNLKGGVGKTTVALGLGEALTKATRRPVLMVDANTEGGLTRWATAGPPRRFRRNLGTALYGHHPVLEAVVDLGKGATPVDPDDPGSAPLDTDEARRAQWAGLHLLPTTSIKIRVEQMAAGEGAITYVSLRTLVRDAIREAARHGVYYAGAIVDPGHNDTDLTLLAMVAADRVVPVVCARQSQSVDQLDALFTLFKQARKNTDHSHVQMGGIVVTDFDAREYLPQQVVLAITNSYGTPGDDTDYTSYPQRLSDRFWGVTPHRSMVERAVNSHQTFGVYGKAIEPIPQVFDAIIQDRVLVSR